MSFISADVLFGWSWLYINWFNFKSLLALCKWRGSYTYNLISFSSDPIIYSTKPAWFLKAPVKRANLPYTYDDLWAQGVKWNARLFKGLGVIYFATSLVTIVSVNSKTIHQSKQKTNNLKWYLPLKIRRLRIAVLATIGCI